MGCDENNRSVMRTPMRQIKTPKIKKINWWIDYKYKLLLTYSVCSRGGSRISEGGVLIAGTDSSGGDMEKFSRGCLQQFVYTNLNAYVSSGAGFKNFRGHLQKKRSQLSALIKKC